MNLSKTNLNLLDFCSKNGGHYIHLSAYIVNFINSTQAPLR